MWPRVRIPARSPNKNPRKFCGGFYLVCQRARFEPGRVRSPQATTHRRNAPSGRLDRRAVGAQSRLASVRILCKFCGGFYLVCRRARFEPGRVRSPQATTHRRNAPSGRLDRRAVGAQSRLASVRILCKFCGGFYLVCRRARFDGGLRIKAERICFNKRKGLFSQAFSDFRVL